MIQPVASINRMLPKHSVVCDSLYRTEGSVLPVLVLHTAVNAWPSVIPVMVLPDGSNLRPFQWVVGILFVAALLLLFRGGPTPQAGTATLQARP